jgi:tripartite-type tricarboxylate transporter receptor subunit TctC
MPRSAIGPGLLLSDACTNWTYIDELAMPERSNMPSCKPKWSRAKLPFARTAIPSIVLTAFLAAISPAAAEFPERNITMIVPFAPGGSTDVIARIVGDHMAKTLGRSIIIENDAGAGGTTPTRRVAQAKADGYTLIIGNLGTHGAAPSQYPNLKYDPAKDFTPIAQTAGLPIVIVTRKEFPADNLKGFVDYVKSNQHKVNEAHGGAGGQMHTTCTLLHSIMGTKTARVAYRGAGPAINDIVAGQVDFACISLTAVVSQIQAGTIKAMAIASPERSDVIKDVPTTKEGGLPEFQVSAWNAIFAPKNLPPDIQAKLNEAVVKALDDEATTKRLLEIGSLIPARNDRTPEALQRLVESEVARWSSVLKAAGAAN